MGKPFQVERSTIIDAPPDAIFPHLVSLKKWEAWSPWQGLDPDMTQTYSGPEAGVGSTMTWSGNRKAGVGTMTVSRVEPDELVAIDLAFDKPFKSESSVEITLTPNGGSTTVRWVMNGEQNALMQVIGKVMSMDKMMGKDFERGLNQLRSTVSS